jgi:hypothetical protein
MKFYLNSFLLAFAVLVIAFYGTITIEKNHANKANYDLRNN